METDLVALLETSVLGFVVIWLLKEKFFAKKDNPGHGNPNGVKQQLKSLKEGVDRSKKNDDQIFARVTASETHLAGIKSDVKNIRNDVTRLMDKVFDGG